MALTGASGSAVVFPGDVLSLRGSVVRLGPGLLQSGSNVVASRAGRIKQGANAKLWVDNVQKRVSSTHLPPHRPHHRPPFHHLLSHSSSTLLFSLPPFPPFPQYLPASEDPVIGVVAERHSENYKVDVGGPELVNLPALAFEGATKRNKPNIPVSLTTPHSNPHPHPDAPAPRLPFLHSLASPLCPPLPPLLCAPFSLSPSLAKLNSLIYCRVLRTHRDMEAELSCISPHIKTDWVAGQSFFGPLEGGVVVSVSLATARRLLSGGEWGREEGAGGGGGGAGAGVLEMCGEWVGYEVAVGLNGRVWVHCDHPYATVLITNAILNSQHMTHLETAAMVKQLFSTLQG